MIPAAPPPGPRRKARQARTPRETQENGENRPPWEDEEGQPPEHKKNEESGENGKNRRIREVWEAQRAALADAFPAWKIVCVADLSIPLWFALYREPLTPQQEQAGFRSSGRSSSRRPRLFRRRCSCSFLNRPPTPSPLARTVHGRSPPR